MAKATSQKLTEQTVHTQFGMIIYGYKHFRDSAAYQKYPVAELSRLYRLVRQLIDYRHVVADQELPAFSF